MNEIDYSKKSFSRGLVCLNTNNNAYCVVLNGNRGNDDDRCSMVLESNGDFGFIIHTPPNRALIPTGRIIDLDKLVKYLQGNLEVTEMDRLMR